MSLIPVVHLDLRISRGIFEENSKTVLMEYSGAGRELIHEKKKTRSKKSRDTVPVKPGVLDACS
jgi:hypothetical protein